MRAADSARVVHLCAARCAPFVAHKWPTHALRLTQALGDKRHVRLWKYTFLEHRLVLQQKSEMLVAFHLLKVRVELGT